MASLAPLSECLWTLFGGRVFFINAVGPNSLLSPPKREKDPTRYGLQLMPYEGELGMAAYGEEDDLSGGHDGCMNWYVVSRKADD